MIDEVLGKVSAYAYAVEKGYTGTETQFAYDLAHAADYASTAGAAAENASESEENAKDSEEAAALSEQNAQTYANNAHSDAAAALDAKAQAITAKNDAVSAKGSAENFASLAEDAKESATQSEQNASQSAESASDDAEAASNSASSASANSLKSEGFAVGEQNGVPVESGSPYYENSAKYYCEEAAEQLTLVTNEGTRQIGLVENEGTAQKAAVQEKGEQTLASIPEDYTTLRNDVSSLKSDFDNVDDVLNTSNAFVIGDKAEYTDGGLTISIVDGIITVSGTATRNVSVIASIYIGVSGDYYFDGCPNSGSQSQYYQRIYKDSVYVDEVGGGRIRHFERGVWTYQFTVISGRTVNFTVAPRLLWIEPGTVYKPVILYGGWNASGKYPYAASYESWANTRKRTDVLFLEKGSVIGFQKLGNVELTVYEYRNYNPAFSISNNIYTGTTFKWTADHSGYYAFNIRKISGQAITHDEINANCTFYFMGKPDQRPKVHFIGSGNLPESSTATDVGDCTLITFYDGNNLLIDSANSRNYTTTEKRLYSAGVKKINNIIISHYHADHIGGLIEWMARTYVDITNATVYLPDPTATQWAADNGVMDATTKSLWDQAMQIFADKNCTIVYPDTEWQTVSIGNAFITFFNTDLSVYENRSTNYNDWSLCNYLIYGNMNVCFTGDLGPIAQSVLSGTLYKANIYKADHHGWLNQPNMAAGYIENVSPDVVIAEDGQTHDDLLVGPNAPLIRWCEANGVPYYRKYQNNEIVMALDEQAYEFVTKVSRYYRPTT